MIYNADAVSILRLIRLFKILKVDMLTSEANKYVQIDYIRSCLRIIGFIFGKIIYI